MQQFWSTQWNIKFHDSRWWPFWIFVPQRPLTFGRVTLSYFLIYTSKETKQLRNQLQCMECFYFSPRWKRLWISEFKSYNLVAILNLKVKSKSNCKISVKYEFLDPQNPKNDIMLQFWSTHGKIKFHDSRWRPFWIFTHQKLCPHFWEGHPLLFSYSYLKEHKKAEKPTSVHGMLSFSP